MKPLKIKVSHLSSLRTLPPKAFTEDVSTALLMRPAWLSMTETHTREPEIHAIAKETGYRPVFYDSKETAVLFDYRSGVRLIGADEFKAHDEGEDYPARYLTRARLLFEGETFNAFQGHWLAHLDDSPQRVRDHNKMTRVAAAKMVEEAKGRVISVLGCDANESDRPGTKEDRSLGEMTTIFNKAGITTCWDEVGKHPTTFGNRPPIDLLATVDEDLRASVLGAYAVNVRGDHDQIGMVMEIQR